MRRRERPTHFTMELYDRGDGTHGIKATRPDEVLSIDSREELDLQLAHYANQDLSQTVPNTNFARRHYVEKIRPALRYYCQKYSVDVPQWLSNDSLFTEEMTSEERDQYFGTSTFAVREFKQLKRLEGIGKNREDRASTQ